MGRSLGFASASADSIAPCSDSLSLRLRPYIRGLTSPATATRRLIMQKARCHPKKKGAPTACGRMVSGTVSLLCKRCFSPFPHGTGSLSVSGECLALADGPAGFTQGSTCPALLRNTTGRGSLRVRGCHPLRRDFPDASARLPAYHHVGPTTPTAPRRARFGLCPVRSPLLGVSLLFSLPAATKMFQFTAFASVLGTDDGTPSRRVAPFGHRGVKGRLRLTRDFRSLPRPSSPSGA